MSMFPNSFLNGLAGAEQSSGVPWQYQQHRTQLKESARNIAALAGCVALAKPFFKPSNSTTGILHHGYSSSLGHSISLPIQEPSASLREASLPHSHTLSLKTG